MQKTAHMASTGKKQDGAGPAAAGGSLFDLRPHPRELGKSYISLACAPSMDEDLEHFTHQAQVEYENTYQMEPPKRYVVFHLLFDLIVCLIAFFPKKVYHSFIKKLIPHDVWSSHPIRGYRIAYHWSMLHFTSTSVVTSHKAMLVLCFHCTTLVHLTSCLHDLLIAKEADMEKALLSCDITTEVIVNILSIA